MNKLETLQAAAEGNGCLGASQDDEPVFVLAARDPLASQAVRDWADPLRDARGRNRKYDVPAPREDSGGATPGHGHGRLARRTPAGETLMELEEAKRTARGMADRFGHEFAVYRFPGWNADVWGVRRCDDLPPGATIAERYRPGLVPEKGQGGLF